MARPASETLVDYSIRESMELMGFETPDKYVALAHELQEITNDPYLGHFYVGEGDDRKRVHAFRAHAGPEQDPDGQPLVAKGGLRQVIDENPDIAEYLAEVSSLSRIMLLKLAALGLHRKYRGGKGLMVAESGEPLSPAEMEEAMRKYYQLMEEREYNKHDVDVPAGDFGVFAHDLNIYADEHQRRHPDDPYGLAVVTGTTPKYGGWLARVEVTGLGGAAAHAAINDHFNGYFDTTVVRGFGDVGAWYAHHATRHGIRVMAVSDKDGTLYTEDPAGMPIDREAIAAAYAHPDYKMSSLAAHLRADGLKVEKTHSDAIYDMEGFTYFPAVKGGEIDGLNAERLRASGTRLVLEGANGPTTMDGQTYLNAAGIRVGPDMVVNGGGVHGSIEQLEAARAQARGEEVTLTDEEMKRRVWEANQEATNRMIIAAAELSTKDWRVAAIGLSTGRLFLANHVPIPDDVRRLVSV